MHDELLARLAIIGGFSAIAEAVLPIDCMTELHFAGMKRNRILNENDIAGDFVGGVMSLSFMPSVGIGHAGWVAILK